MAIINTIEKIKEHLNREDLKDQFNKIKLEGIYKYLYRRIIVPNIKAEEIIVSHRQESYIYEFGFKSISIKEVDGNLKGYIYIYTELPAVRYEMKIDFKTEPNSMFLTPTTYDLIDDKILPELGLLEIKNGEITTHVKLWDKDEPEFTMITSFIIFNSDNRTFKIVDEAPLGYDNSFNGYLMRTNWSLANDTNLNKNLKIKELSNISNTYNGLGIATDHSGNQSVFVYQSYENLNMTLANIQKYLNIELGRAGFKSWKLGGLEFFSGGLYINRQKQKGAEPDIVSAPDYIKDKESSSTGLLRGDLIVITI